LAFFGPDLVWPFLALFTNVDLVSVDQSLRAFNGLAGIFRLHSQPIHIITNLAADQEPALALLLFITLHDAVQTVT
jgi:hypothetical protein